MPDVQMRVNHGRRQIAVPEHFLNRAQVGAMNQHVGDEAVPEDGVPYELRESDRICLEKLGLLDRLPEFRRLALQAES